MLRNSFGRWFPASKHWKGHCLVPTNLNSESKNVSLCIFQQNLAPTTAGFLSLTNDTPAGHLGFPLSWYCRSLVAVPLLTSCDSIPCKSQESAHVEDLCSLQPHKRFSMFETPECLNISKWLMVSVSLMLAFQSNENSAKISIKTSISFVSVGLILAANDMDDRSAHFQHRMNSEYCARKWLIKRDWISSKPRSQARYFLVNPH